MPGSVRRLPPRRLDVEVAQYRRGRVPGLPPAAPDLGERAGIAEDLADLGLALRDALSGSKGRPTSCDQGRQARQGRGA
jgi:hypothetical protein